jgi:DNA-directed RNA polymerase specialized sigma24 family protein
MTLEEAAKVMGCAIGTAKSTVHAALKSLKVQMEESVDT